MGVSCMHRCSPTGKALQDNSYCGIEDRAPTGAPSSLRNRKQDARSPAQHHDPHRWRPPRIRAVNIRGFGPFLYILLAGGGP